MRTPVIALSLLGAAVISPTLAAPTVAAHRRADSQTTHYQGGGDMLAARSLRPPNPRVSTTTISPSASWRAMEFWKRTDRLSLKKRLGDERTMGGNAKSGNSGAVNGGSVYNPDTTNNEGMPVIMNVNSNNAGLGGASNSGCASSGRSGKHGVGGNAASGNSGEAVGGNVNEGPSGMFNMDSNNAGSAGQSLTGCAEGGDTYDPEELDGLNEGAAATDDRVTEERLEEPLQAEADNGHRNPFPNEQ
ncbi:hypothetical protein EUX98_g2199 [Antrodiella citrinella]|uniref:Uncharacterized protein n=1 Tax=Antrodiella citrinella TaxID=2447956 RepID=A0A4S4N1V1_9APHY|nr:hypothetical protein EUX98_g2199 [Antrodiella citrinella]